jgi:vacuolar-type H+-ATPase subunit E/Vma4
MSQDSLEHQLIDKINQQRNDMLESAHEKAKNILRKAEAEKLRIEDQTNKAIEGIIGSELRAVHDRIVGGAQLQGRKTLMESRTELINKVFDEASAEIKALVEKPEYHEHLVKLVKESVKNLNEDCIVYANERDLAYLKDNTDRFAVDEISVLLEKSPEPIEGGVTVVNLNGTKTIHNTLHSRLRDSKERLISDVAKKLGVI